MKLLNVLGLPCIGISQMAKLRLFLKFIDVDGWEVLWKFLTRTQGMESRLSTWRKKILGIHSAACIHNQFSSHEIAEVKA